MLVETYEQTEITANITPECDAESIALIESLGLAGQRKLVTSPGDVPQIRSPYRRMTREEEQVYKLLMPKECQLSVYEDGPVPLRVLQVAAHAQGLFKWLMVWCPETGPKDDPLLVGVNGSYMHSGERSILARWGDCLLPFSDLKAKAVALARGKVRDAVAKVVSESQAMAERVDTMSDELVLKHALSEPQFFHQ